MVASARPLPWSDGDTPATTAVDPTTRDGDMSAVRGMVREAWPTLALLAGLVLAWEATVTFTRISKEDYPDGPITEDDIPDVPPPPVLTEDDIPMPGQPRLRPDGRKASAAVTCPAGCTGTVVAKVGSRVLARSRVRLAAGPRPQRVTVRFGRRAARAVRRAGRVRLAFTLRTATGEPVRRVVTAWA